ncbi:hypothetical protein [Halorussus halobius]|uniref:hypothetical protein n=1 Tax=Halorussus halobius TaxID=1710537 RepID=UPI0010919658|nr:hypothetical protein [Halorussus halobius]
MTEGTDQQDLYTAAEYREHVEGKGSREPDAHDFSGIVRDESVSRFMAVQSEEHDPTEWDDVGHAPGRAEDLREMRQMRSLAATEVARTAMETGDTMALKHLTGDADRQADVSGMKAIGRVDNLLTGPAPVIVIIGEMGAGKTDFACLLGQRWKDHNPSGLVGTNIGSLRERDDWTDRDGEARDGFVSDYGTLEEWVKQDGDPLEHRQTPKLFMGDEFSSVASGSGKQGHLVRKRMGPLVFKIRKYGGTLVYIAHDESSIHPLLWRVGVVIKKTSKKEAVVADSIKSGEIRDVQFEIEGVPPTDWQFNTLEASDWSWSEHGDEDEWEPDEAARATAIWTAIRCKEEGMSDRETAEYVPYSHGWVNSRWTEYMQEDRHEETLARVEEVIA